jgi:hypothetical protein
VQQLELGLRQPPQLPLVLALLKCRVLQLQVLLLRVLVELLRVQVLQRLSASLLAPLLSRLPLWLQGWLLQV